MSLVKSLPYEVCNCFAVLTTLSMYKRYNTRKRIIKMISVLPREENQTIKEALFEVGKYTQGSENEEYFIFQW